MWTVQKYFYYTFTIMFLFYFVIKEKNVSSLSKHKIHIKKGITDVDAHLS